MRGLSEEANRLLQSICRQPTWFERFRSDSARAEALKELAALGEPRVIPDLLPLVVAGGATGLAAADVVAKLLEQVSPEDLASIDEAARWSQWGPTDAWQSLRSAAVPELCRTLATCPTVVGLLSSHSSGYVRAAVVDELAAFTNGSEIPFLALRANDWVEPVASRAAEELSRRLVVENRPAVLANLPFIARLFAQQRQDHSRFKDALKVVLTADGGAAALASVKGFETSTRRLVYDLLRSTALTSDAAVVRAALTDRDPVVKRRAVRWLERTEDAAGTIATLERVAVIDRIPLVRRDAIAVLAARAPDRTRQLLRGFLLDSSGPVRSLAQFLVGRLQAPIVAADVYVESLDSSSPRTLAAALDGLRETGLAIGESRIVAFRHHPAPLVRKSVLRSLGAMTPDACVIAALDALSDPAPSVRATAAAILRVHVYRVDLSALQECFDGLSDSRARRQLLRVFRQAPKWSAAELLLEAVGDEDFDVRRDAEGLLRSWLNGFNRAQTPPTSDQLDRVSRRFHAQISRLAPDVARDLGFIVRSFVTPS